MGTRILLPALIADFHLRLEKFEGAKAVCGPRTELPMLQHVQDTHQVSHIFYL